MNHQLRREIDEEDELLRREAIRARGDPDPGPVPEREYDSDRSEYEEPDPIDVDVVMARINYGLMPRLKRESVEEAVVRKKKLLVLVPSRYDDWTPVDHEEPRPSMKKRHVGPDPCSGMTEVQFQCHPSQTGKTNNNHYRHLWSMQSGTNVADAAVMYYANEEVGSVIDKEDMMVYVVAANDEDDILRVIPVRREDELTVGQLSRMRQAGAPLCLWYKKMSTNEVEKADSKKSSGKSTVTPTSTRIKTGPTPGSKTSSSKDYAVFGNPKRSTRSGTNDKKSKDKKRKSGPSEAETVDR